ncbi:ATP-binding protein [Caenispirillum bisanense]|uniref:hybrid sensor histidine kinase/response regulator n=1 Tax=Caenispirillum bisanense TaxID=414052 RepID=UPI00159652A5|nr:ATP-binding protein [Caenispirillum bisanense]
MQAITILLVEDNPADARFVQLMLAEGTTARYVVTEASSLAAARAHLAAHVPDVVLLDMHLPDSRGMPTVEAVVALCPETPVVVLTGLDDEEIGMEAIRAGAQDFLVKGFTDGTLVRRVIAHAIERRRIGVELEHAHAELARSNAEKDRFFSIIAHDLKSPFNALLGFSEVLLARAPAMPPQQVLEYVQIIHDSGKAAYELLENLLEWSRLQLGRMEIRPEPVSLARLADRVTTLHRLAAEEKGITLRHRVDGYHVLADPAVVDTILRNLVGNAVKFTEPGGTVAITAAPAPDAPGRIALTVTDTGVGMSAARVAELFHIDRPISTAGTRGEKGTGLGLVLCAELAAKSGGRITVDSTPGAGTRFHVLLPAAEVAEVAWRAEQEEAVA